MWTAIAAGPLRARRFTRGHILGKGPSRDRPPALSRMAVSMAVTDASSLSGLARLSFFRKQPRKELPYLRRKISFLIFAF